MDPPTSADSSLTACAGGAAVSGAMQSRAPLTSAYAAPGREKRQSCCTTPHQQQQSSEMETLPPIQLLHQHPQDSKALQTHPIGPFASMAATPTYHTPNPTAWASSPCHSDDGDDEHYSFRGPVTNCMPPSAIQASYNHPSFSPKAWSYADRTAYSLGIDTSHQHLQLQPLRLPTPSTTQSDLQLRPSLPSPYSSNIFANGFNTRQVESRSIAMVSQEHRQLAASTVPAGPCSHPASSRSISTGEVPHSVTATSISMDMLRLRTDMDVDKEMTTDPSSYPEDGFGPRATTQSPAMILNTSIRPEEPYAQLIFRAFMSTPRHALTLQEIYQWFRENTDKAKSESKGWQNSIRHNLSMNAAFTKRERTKSDAAKTPTEPSRSSPPPPGASGAIASDAKKSTEWFLEEWAVSGGVQSTTRYRKGTVTRRSQGGNPVGSHPTKARDGSFSAAAAAVSKLSQVGSGLGSLTGRSGAGRKGGCAASKANKQRSRHSYSSPGQQMDMTHLNPAAHDTHGLPGARRSTYHSNYEQSPPQHVQSLPSYVRAFDPYYAPNAAPDCVTPRGETVPLSPVNVEYDSSVKVEYDEPVTPELSPGSTYGLMLPLPDPISSGYPSHHLHLHGDGHSGVLGSGAGGCFPAAASAGSPYDLSQYTLNDVSGVYPGSRIFEHDDALCSWGSDCDGV